MANINVKDLGYYHPEPVNPIGFIRDLSPSQLNLYGGCTIRRSISEEHQLIRPICPFSPRLFGPFNLPKR
jgi:hypothetical protein